MNGVLKVYKKNLQWFATTEQLGNKLPGPSKVYISDLYDNARFKAGALISMVENGETHKASKHGLTFRKLLVDERITTKGEPIPGQHMCDAMPCNVIPKSTAMSLPMGVVGDVNKRVKFPGDEESKVITDFLAPIKNYNGVDFMSLGQEACKKEDKPNFTFIGSEKIMIIYRGAVFDEIAQQYSLCYSLLKVSGSRSNTLVNVTSSSLTIYVGYDLPSLANKKGNEILDFVERNRWSFIHHALIKDLPQITYSTGNVDAVRVDKDELDIVSKHFNIPTDALMQNMSSTTRNPYTGSLPSKTPVKSAISILDHFVNTEFEKRKVRGF